MPRNSLLLKIPENSVFVQNENPKFGLHRKMKIKKI
jgi:hypothetical protein